MRVLRFTVPAGTVAAVASLIAYGLAFYGDDLTLRESRTAATLVLSAVGLWVLVCLARPFNWWRTLLVAVDGRLDRGDPARAGAADFYELNVPATEVVAEMIVISRARRSRRSKRCGAHPAEHRASQPGVRGGGRGRRSDASLSTARC